MIVKKLQPLIVLAILFLLASCSSIYMPNVPATPMFRNQGEAYVSGHINTQGNMSGSFGVAATDHIAIITNGSYIKSGIKSNEQFDQKLIEGGVGYFAKMGKDKKQILEFYGGYGIGNTLNIDKRASTMGFEAVETREMDFDKIFVQVNYSSTQKRKLNLFGNKRELNYGTAIRLSRVGMTDFVVDGVGVQKEENLFIEPVFFTRLELFKGFQLQYTTGFNIGVVDNEYLKAGNSIFTLGVSYNLGQKK
ncbi:hypothetical protein FAZ15_17985 [Sphingobacterium olei]|uniref:Outer membrane protein beta-barrel domain-containing protein n=1 Tax=Sphingobacterium olei TaxID=2571155 RepID=A0A4U0NGG4_9SPHI|nr:hypothetical protein [Sphingobacterium olei]TJZ53247.1 hypothetical protein FAZ15_17985 [Sphingobacterium olei]